MADKYTKASVSSPVEESSDAWKSVSVEKEHQPATVESTLSYGHMELEVAELNEQIASLEKIKTTIEAEMAKVKAAVEA